MTACASRGEDQVGVDVCVATSVRSGLDLRYETFVYYDETIDGSSSFCNTTHRVTEMSVICSNRSISHV